MIVERSRTICRRGIERSAAGVVCVRNDAALWGGLAGGICRNMLERWE